MEDNNKSILDEVMGGEKAPSDEKQKQCEVVLFKQKLMNICLLLFTFVLTVVTLVTFFVATFAYDNPNGATIASAYTLCMLLAIPTMKVAIDKLKCPVMKALNVVGIVLSFATILIITVVMSITLAFPG